MAENLIQLRIGEVPDNIINQKLTELYQENWNGYISEIRGNLNATNPQLICVSNEYASAEIKVVVVGQETFFWGGEFDQEIREGRYPTINDLQLLYNKFANEKFGYNSPFWNFMKRLKLKSDGIGIVSTNIIKIGRNGKGYDNEVKDLTKEYFNVIRKELEILQPDLVVFTTGPKYDKIIKEFLGEVNILLDNNKLAIYKIEGLSYGAIRTYHPHYMSRKRLYFETINYVTNLILR